MQAINLRAFRLRARHHKRSLRIFLSRLQKSTPPYLDEIARVVHEEVWKDTNCLSCGNCCKTMTPTYTLKDIKRISAYLGMTVKEFKDKWLVYQKKSREWINKQQPCQFLDGETNFCTIYDVRPADCAGFPHFTKKRFVDYVHVHKQNIEYCPATLKMIENMKQLLTKDKRLQ